MRRCLALSILSLLILAGSASATPVTIDFESGAALDEAVTNQYGPPGTPAGPEFKQGTDASPEHFKKLECRPPHLDGVEKANSGSRALKLDGCPTGEFHASAAFFHVGYATGKVEFWVALNTPELAITQIVSTAFNAKGEIVMQEETLLPPQSEATYKPVALESGKGDIAYVAIELGEKGTEPESATGVGLSVGGAYLLVDDLTYYPPASPPESSFLLGASPPKTSVAAGDHVAIKVPITWTNNPEPSKSKVALEAFTPEGVEASFSENPSSSGSSTLTLDVAKNAEAGSTVVAVTGYVEKGGPHEKKATVEIPIQILVPFFVVEPGSWSVAPCTPQQIPLRVATVGNFSQPLTLQVNTESQPGVTITSISSGSVLDASHAVTTVSQHSGEANATLTVEVAPGTKPAGARPWFLTALSSGYASGAATGTIAIEAGHVSQATSNGVPASTVSTPQLGIPGSQLTLKGTGFCAGTKVAIGDPDNAATPESISGDGSSLSLRVPRGASTGPIHVLPATGQGFDGPSLTVRSFRNTFGFSWKNGDYGLRLNGDMVDELFGQEETNINVFGWLVRKPEASLFEAMANKHIPGGICFGIAYSSLEFRDFPQESFSFPRAGGNDPWHMASPSAPSEPLLRYATERFSLQFTDQLIPAELNAVLGIHGANDDINTIKAELAQGEPVMIGLIHWNGLGIEGHTVLAYDTHPLPDGSTSVDVANSNVPYMTSEESNAKAHDTAEFTNSQIIIKEGNWTFPEGADFKGSGGLPWSGSEADLVVYKHSELPILNGQRPKLPNVFTAGVMVVFGSSGDGVTQLSDGHGSLFSGGRLAPQSSWPKGVAPIADFTSSPGPLQLVSFDPKRARPLTATVKRSANGGAMNMNLPGLQTSLQAGAHAGQIDHVTVDPRSDSIGYQATSSSATLGGTLLSSASSAAGARASVATTSALSDHLVQFQTTTSRGAEQLSFPGGRELILHHAGPPVSLSLTLAAFGANGQPIAVRLPPVRVLGGEILRVRPGSWRALGSSLVQISATVHGHTSTRRVRGRTIGRRFATVRRAALVALGRGSYRIDLVLGMKHAPQQAWLSVATTVVRGGHVIEQARPIQLSGSALSAGRADLTLPKPLSPGRYSLRTRLLEATVSGPVQGSQTVSSTLTVSAGKR